VNAPVFFFTAEDPREIPKGSRDPLRVIPLWSGIARNMIPHLTTVTPSYRGFLTRVLFHGALETLRPQLAQASREVQWTAFAKFEQLCGIVRATSEAATPQLPGITGTTGRVDEDVFTIGEQTPYWLVKSQKMTGFWGYYHQASVGSGILQRNTAPNAGYVLSDEASTAFHQSSAAALIHEYADILTDVFDSDAITLELPAFGALAKYFAAQPVGEAAWGEFWINHLLTPSSKSTNTHDAATQSAFAREIKAAVERDPTVSTGDVWEQLAEQGQHANVTSYARAVRATEAIIGLCEWVFDVCRLRQESGETLQTAAEWAQEQYNGKWLQRLRALEAPYSEELQRYRDIALRSNDSFVELATVLLTKHASVMRARSGAPWVELLDGNVLQIRELSDDPWPPDFERYPSGVRWRYDYFLSAWISIAKEIGYIQEPLDE